MDTFSGLAFSFEPPLIETMQEKPKSLKEPIINKYMYSQIIFTGLYSAIICVIFLKSNIVRNFIRTGPNYEYLMTAYFALFIFIGIFNAFNARTERKNLLANICKNKIFIIMFSFIAIVQIYLIYHGGDLFRTYGLTIKELIFVLIIAFSVIPVDILRKYFIKNN
jgi:magnesium-transporting ATPase (P-type)